MFLADAPIRQKLMASFLLTTLVVLALTCAMFIAYEVITLRKGMVDGYMTRARIIAANSTAALAFQNESDATQVLGALKTDPRILMACIYDREGRLFARYPADAPSAAFPLKPGENGYHSGYLEVFGPVVEGDRTLGTVYLRSDLSTLTDRYRAYAWLVLVVIAGSLVLGYFLSNALQKQISEPILALAETARAITVNRDYSTRARKFGEDELGALTDAFNQMLAEILASGQKLAERTRLLDLVMGSMSEGVVVADKDGKMTYFNRAAERIVGLGISSGDFSQWTKEYGVFKEDTVTPYPEEELPLIRAVRGQSEDGTVQFFRNKTNPQGVFASINARPLKYEDGKLVGGVVVIRDITQQKKLQEALASRDFIASVLENLPNMVFVKDAKDLRFVMFNKAGEQLLGFSRAELIGKNDHDFFPEAEADFFTAKDRNVIEGGKVLDIPDETIQTKDKGPRILHTKKFPVYGSDGKPQYLMGISEDITEQKEQEGLKIYLKALETSNKEMQDFVFVASHDLQEPLRKIQSFGEFLRTEFKEVLGETGGDYVERMRSAAQRMQVLINDLLALTRVTTKAQPFVPVDLSEVLQGVLSDLETRIADTKGRVTVEKLPTLAADATQMRQLFQNLIGNALKFQKPGVTPEIRISAEILKGKGRTGDLCRIIVEDNGIGFDNKYADQIFKVFERLHGRDEYAGTGIGLAICRKVVERHGGTIKAEGQPGKGSRFIVELPLQQRG